LHPPVDNTSIEKMPSAQAGDEVAIGCARVAAGVLAIAQSSPRIRNSAHSWNDVVIWWSVLFSAHSTP
jgi:hypothetical protein